ncbi:hypothetical protein [Agrobacterium pusense]|uniref:hypothetical protein n=1 Tax=Agrobacterium pusense TaxID=648995 RepID=UPI000D380594|nr:hypothetical protein [Agrobacterium pusense]PTV70179.1 hypothetical protein DBL06_25280 [Agrobacterium pusense]
MTDWNNIYANEFAPKSFIEKVQEYGPATAQAYETLRRVQSNLSSINALKGKLEFDYGFMGSEDNQVTLNIRINGIWSQPQIGSLVCERGTTQLYLTRRSGREDLSADEVTRRVLAIR